MRKFAVYRLAEAHIATMPTASWLRPVMMLAAFGLALLIWSQDADARLKSEWRFGGSAAHLFTSSRAAANDMSTFDGSMRPYAAQPTYPGGSLVGLFSRPGLTGGFAAGFLGAGLLGVVFGYGVTGELTSVAAFLGLIFQLALVVLLARLFWTWWHVGKAASFPVLSPRQLADAYGRTRNETLPNIDPAADAETTLGKTGNDPTR
jgi:hypothetical protein